MPSTDIYARCNFTRSGHPNIRFNVIIKVLKAKLEELRELPANRDQTDNQLLGSLAGKVITIVYPEPGAMFAVGCERYPEGAIPTEIKERPEGTKLADNDEHHGTGDNDKLQGNQKIPVVPEANAAWVLIPFVGAVLLFSGRNLFRGEVAE